VNRRVRSGSTSFPTGKRKCQKFSAVLRSWSNIFDRLCLCRLVMCRFGAVGSRKVKSSKVC